MNEAKAQVRGFQLYKDLSKNPGTSTTLVKLSRFSLRDTKSIEVPLETVNIPVFVLLSTKTTIRISAFWKTFKGIEAIDAFGDSLLLHIECHSSS